MQVFTLHLPDELASVLSAMREQQNRFVAEAIREKLAREQRLSLRVQLIEGYAATREKERIITEDFDSTTKNEQH